MELYKKFFDFSLDLLCIANTEGYFLRVNPAFTKVLGWTEEELKAKPFLDFVHPDDIEATLVEVAKLSLGEQTIHLENRYQHKEGHWVWLSWTSYPDPDTGERFAVAHDISVIKEALEQSNHKQYLLDESQRMSQTCSWKLDMVNNVLTWTKEGYRIFGVPIETTLNAELFLKYIYIEDHKLVEEEWKAAINEKRPFQLIYRLFVDNQIKWVDTQAVIHYDTNGIPTHAIGFIQDITQFKEIEAQLQQAKQEAEQNAQIKESFLANMSHEIRTPMSGIFGFSRLLLQSPINETQRQYAQSIYSSAEGLLSVINDILDVSKMESGQFQIQHREFDLHDKIENALRILRVSIDEKRLELEVDIDNTIPSHLIGDPNRISQILINLIGNAIKFTDKGKITLRVTLKELDLNKFLWFEIEDTGIGIPSEKLGNIFESFTQVENYITREHSGTGLGLSICSELVRLMGGEIGVTSTLDIGSTFYFTIPFVPCQQPNLEKISSEKLVLSNQIIGDINILVVEDYPLNQELVGIYLRMLKCPYDLAVNGLEAVEMVAKNNYDIILMDIQMPKMDGIEATTQIRKTNSTIPIVAMTAHALKKEKQKCIDIGMNDYLTKPFKIEELQDLILKHTSPNLIEVSSDTPFSHLLETMDGNQRLVNELLSIFKIEIVKLIDEMESAIARHDIEKVRNLRHKIKPSLELFKLSKQATLFSQIEELYKTNADIEEIEYYFQELKATIPILLKHVDVELEKKD